MTIQELEQYADLKKELADLRKRIEHLSGKSSVVHDTVRGSMSEFPYCSHTIRIDGVSNRSARLVKSLAQQYARKEAALLEQTILIESWMDTIRDAKIRRIVRYRYEDGLTWMEVSRRVYGHRSENRARMTLNRYFTHCS